MNSLKDAIKGQRKYRAKSYYKKTIGQLSQKELENDMQLQLLERWKDSLRNQFDDETSMSNTEYDAQTNQNFVFDDASSVFNQSNLDQTEI